MHQILTPSPMPSLPLEAAIQLMQKRFEKDAIITLATIYEGRPYAREVDAWYHDGSFYFLTCKDSRKVQHIAANPQVAVAALWFDGVGTAVNLHDFRSPENAEIFRQLKSVFTWFQEQEDGFATPYTEIIRIDLQEGEIIWQDHICKIAF